MRQTATATIGQNLKRLRGEMTQESLAEKTKLDRTTIARIEGGRYEGVRSTTLSALAKALSVDVADFFAAPRRQAKRPAAR